MSREPGAGHPVFVLPAGDDPDGAVTGLLGRALSSGAVDALLLPVELPAGDSFAWILTRDAALVAEARAMAPLMPVQGALALRGLTRKGESQVRILALMRPCEVRAARELSKLRQVKTDSLLLATWDCPGAVPMKDYLADPAGGKERFAAMLAAGGPSSDGGVKPSCLGCIDFSMTDADLHFGNLGSEEGAIPVLAGSPAGRTFLEALGLEAGADPAPWRVRVEEERQRRGTVRTAALEDIGGRLRGAAGMLAVFADCIGCRNCRAACPVCYCRLCHFDSETPKPDPDAFLDAAGLRGGVSLPANRLLFHVGRMAHMSLSCVACGQCSDACPVNVPVAEAFAFVGRATREAFGYEAGRDDGVPPPLRSWLKSEPEGIRDLVRDAEPGGCAHDD